MIRLLKYVSFAILAIGGLWFFAACETTISADKCNGELMEPGDVCMSSRGGARTYEESVADKERGPGQLKIAGTILVAGLVFNIAVGVIALRSEPIED